MDYQLGYYCLKELIMDYQLGYQAQVVIINYPSEFSPTQPQHQIQPYQLLYISYDWLIQYDYLYSEDYSFCVAQISQ